MSARKRPGDYESRLGKTLEQKQPEAVIYKTSQVTLSTGVVLVANSISPVVFQDINDRFPDPPVPLIYDQDRDREIPNPAHPDYLKECQEAEAQRAMAALDAMVALGTKLVSVPEGMVKPDSEEWEQQLAITGHSEAIGKPLLRYVLWIKFMAAPGNDDWQRVAQAVFRLAGVTESDVEAALRSFPDQAERQPDLGSATALRDSDGD